jgi:c(7)-type cytochrome triheme protein
MAMTRCPTELRIVLSIVVALVLAFAASAAGEAPLRLPPDLVFRGAEGSPGMVTFDHGSHLNEKKPECTTCHPAVFRILKTGSTAPLRVDHASMDAGRQCGACHNGTRAFGLDQCALCHREQ